MAEPLFLETERLILRLPAPEDAEPILTAFHAPQFPTNLPLGQIGSLRGVQRWIGQCHRRYVEGRGYSWVMINRENGLISGQITINRREAVDQWALAFWTHPNDWGRGYATEAGGAVTVFCFDSLGAASIWAAAATWNLASLRVLNKLGFEFLEENREGYLIDGQAVPTREFQLNKDRWEQVQNQ